MKSKMSVIIHNKIKTLTTVNQLYYIKRNRHILILILWLMYLNTINFIQVPSYVDDQQFVEIFQVHGILKTVLYEHLF